MNIKSILQKEIHFKKINNKQISFFFREAYVNQYDLLMGLKKNGTFLLNCTWSEDEVDKHLPAGIKRFIYENDIQFYTINATDLAEKIGLGNRIKLISLFELKIIFAFFCLLNPVFFQLNSFFPTSIRFCELLL